VYNVSIDLVLLGYEVERFMRQVLFLFSMFGLALRRQTQAFLSCLDIQGDQAEGGQGLVEYALILVLVAVVVIVATALYGDALANMYDGAITKLVEVFTGGGSP
jgi:pilus assembly protein Flp/PilA